eukprot:SAG31_NODE_95_length_25901_cov_24.763700_3_plen_56_part_00
MPDGEILSADTFSAPPEAVWPCLQSSCLRAKTAAATDTCALHTRWGNNKGPLLRT